VHRVRTPPPEGIYDRNRSFKKRSESPAIRSNPAEPGIAPGGLRPQVNATFGVPDPGSKVQSEMNEGDFDTRALYRAMDQKRQLRSMTWAEVTREVNAPLPGLRSISTSTITGVRGRGSVEADGVLQMLRWLDQTPEAFCAGVECAESLSAQLPALKAGEVLRFDPRAIHAALARERVTQRMTWQQVAQAIGGVSAAKLQRLEAGGRVGFPSVMRVVRWLGRPASTFMRRSPW